ncbi:uncharacterized protein LOC6586190 [Drosophila mojavensis]|uniref:Uncharacterized protein, isoform A n=1 Tax=Drosophila mojavensis TaxID=7230 RepID=B4L8F9_DROMO|nr:uncharacterized protein LOC6586190 [Drosophila mojavensis]XP_015015952.1 uncharacterized protein LOC6586190 [Drosophila mojavensis]EDW07934.1 uncharacterized protein Dmoj_GI14406, isoform A [Drosophila mojavensis]KRG07533.1 uncharacterized protein Dmoj_GI14406, isoform B [Drosophila mojavensis]
MTQFWQMTKNMMGWWLAEEEDCNCDYHDDDETEVQESSGVGTIILIYMALVGIFIGGNIILRQLTQSSPTLIGRKMRKEQQQRRRSRHSANEVNRRPRRRLVLDNWHDAVEPTAEEEVQLLQLKDKDLYFELPDDNIDDDHFVEARDN